MVKQLLAIDFFCGGGGMTYGMQQAGVKVLAGIDFDINCKETYEKNNSGAIFLHKDVTQYPVQDLAKEIKIKRNDDNLIFIGCSPCQYWSIIRSDKTKSQKSKNLLIIFRKFVEHYKPGYVVIENVPGINKKQEESGLTSFISWLEENNYDVHHHIVNLNNYGVPQSRKRFSLIASRVKKIAFPKEQRKKPVVRDFLGEENGFIKISAGNRDETNFMHTCSSLSKTNLLRLKKVKKDGGNRLDFADNPKLQLKCYAGKDDSFLDNFGRIAWDKPSPTITTKFYSISCGRFAHPEEDRPLSLREGASLQTFPKSYKFYGSSIAKISRLIGNAVPPKYSKLIGESILA